MWWYPHEPAGEGREEAVHAATRERIESVWTRIDAHLAQPGPYLLGDWPCAADFYLTMLMRWSRHMTRPATAWPHLDALRSAEPTSELQSLIRTAADVCCLKNTQ